MHFISYFILFVKTQSIQRSKTNMCQTYSRGCFSSSTRGYNRKEKEGGGRLNARSIPFEYSLQKKRQSLALITLSAFLQTRRENSIPSSRQWIKYVGSASERRMDSHDGADVVHGVSSTQPAIGQSILRRSRECLSSRVLSVSAFFFFFLGGNLEGRNSRETFATRRPH